MTITTLGQPDADKLRAAREQLDEDARCFDALAVCVEGLPNRVRKALPPALRPAALREQARRARRARAT